MTAVPLDDGIMQIRVERVTEQFATDFSAAQSKGMVRDVVLDLRSSDGDLAAVAAAQKFLAAQKLRLVMLVNRQTRGAAAELALRLRSAKAGVVIGSTDLTGALSPDIAVKVSAADEKKFLTNPFALTTTNEAPSLAAKNELLPLIDHMSEAELVRKRIKDGEEDVETLTPRAEPAQPVIRDPVLVRAVDLLKALTIFRNK